MRPSLSTHPTQWRHRQPHGGRVRRQQRLLSPRPRPRRRVLLAREGIAPALNEWNFPSDVEMSSSPPTARGAGRRRSHGYGGRPWPSGREASDSLHAWETRPTTVKHTKGARATHTSAKGFDSAFNPQDVPDALRRFQIGKGLTRAQLISMYRLQLPKWRPAFVANHTPRPRRPARPLSLRSG